MFDQLRSACANHDIDLMLVHGQATRRELIKHDEGHLPWAIKVQNKVWEIGSRDLIWQPFPEDAKNADLVILMQESRILSNYPLLLSRLWGARKVAYWGHGKNFQSDAPTGMRERWKDMLLTRVDWWFSYTSATTKILKAAGFPEKKITQLENAIDTTEFKKHLDSWTIDEISQERANLGIDPNAAVAIFCGSLYPDKRLDLLTSISDKIRKKIPSFHLIVIGDGPSMPEMRIAAQTRPWIHILGVQKNKRKALYFNMADIMINPGLVGLHIVDAFCAGIVMVTTTNAKHSPEVAYLVHNKNGLILDDNDEIIAARIISLIENKEELRTIQRNSLSESHLYTQEGMVKNFATGIINALREHHNS
ncbi:glycosyltransferase family 4 protein [Leptothrix discophora]|uniref:Glycosyltransferase family 4 protein n=1 Tax=Leptothrix discophora TaxID=89 RepID=A0ABT9FXW2_LEPDI|nr:glycosyltransferase family 4 protein [Leptothrix discophora]MDP4299067.1 glycosyltransferase family 4 protein [Leptothrix discophora]